ncbi:MULTISPECIES: hypothetical protein [Nocardiopsis]|uniref:Uncharacterized protein n=1 Tax=Nocardiopsis sinuspersici TaxID=501010 RepID=A0A1V3C017_9ACTN|nr:MULTISPECIES: hypothetical protein [Nocardiopsis]OOC54151.1 hypothetical protein NOSIN_10315 [Nocardiopsis sinuspersici]
MSAPTTLAEQYARITRARDEDLAADLLALTPTHEGRDRDRLRAWAAAALRFGERMADEDAGEPGDTAAPEVSERATGGLRPGEVLLAEFVHRSAGDRVVVYTDALDYARRVARAAGWGRDYTRAALRETALSHEHAHRMLLHGGRGRSLLRELDHVVLSLGPLRLRGHVVGADEIAAHAYARRRAGLRRSPVALTAAIAATLAHRGPEPDRTPPRTSPGECP